MGETYMRKLMVKGIYGYLEEEQNCKLFFGLLK